MARCACYGLDPALLCSSVQPKWQKIYCIRQVDLRSPCNKYRVWYLIQRGSIYSSRPSQTEFRANAWPWRLLITPAGGTFQFLRKLYNTVLNWQQTVKLLKYQDFESKIFIHALLDDSDEFLANVERFALSVIFSACYGVRLAQINHPIMNEFYSIWHEMIQCKQYITSLEHE